MRTRILLGILFLVVAAFGLFAISPEEAIEIAGRHQEFVMLHETLVLILFGIMIAVCFGLVIPVGVIFDVWLGFLYGFWTGVAVTLIGSIVGAIAVYMWGKYGGKSLAEFLIGPPYEHIYREAKEHPMSFLLTTRFTPLVPFPIVHLMPAIAGIPLFHFLWVTIAGIILPVIAFVAVGDGLRLSFFSSMGGSSPILVTGGIFSTAILALVFIRQAVLRRKKRNDILSANNE